MNINQTKNSENLNESVAQINQLHHQECHIYEKGLEQIPEQQAIVSRKKRKGNRLLFGITVTTLTGIMAGTVFYAMHQNQPQKTSLQSMNSDHVI